MTREEIMSLKPGEELNKLIAIQVFKEPEPPIDPNVDAFGEMVCGDPVESPKKAWLLGTTGFDHGDKPKWYPREFSTNMYFAWRIVEYISGLVCPFANTDGVFKLLRMDWGDHNQHSTDEDTITLETGVIQRHQPCNLIHSKEHEEKGNHERPNDDDIDPEPWSAHFHIELISEQFANSGDMPKHWKHGSSFCAYGATPAEAICKAALMALVVRS